MITELEKYNRQQNEIDKLKKKIKELRIDRAYYKRRWLFLRDYKPTLAQSRTMKAEVYINAWLGGDKSISLKQIADNCFLSLKTVQNVMGKLKRVNTG